MNRRFDGIRAVFFDAVGTLLFPTKPITQVYADVASQFGGAPLESAQLRERFLKAFAAEEQRDVEAGWRTSEEWEIARWRRIVSACLPDGTDPELAFAELFGHFATPAAWKLPPDAELVLRELHQRGLMLGMGSNYDARLQSVVAGHPELERLSHVLISSLVGWRKPAAGFFAAVIEAANIAPNEILFVGDDLRNDYQGASEAGLRAVLIDAKGTPPGVADRIATLGELLI